MSWATYQCIPWDKPWSHRPGTWPSWWASLPSYNLLGTDESRDTRREVSLRGATHLIHLSHHLSTGEQGKEGGWIGRELNSKRHEPGVGQLTESNLRLVADTTAALCCSSVPPLSSTRILLRLAIGQPDALKRGKKKWKNMLIKIINSIQFSRIKLIPHSFSYIVQIFHLATTVKSLRANLVVLAKSDDTHRITGKDNDGQFYCYKFYSTDSLNCFYFCCPCPCKLGTEMDTLDGRTEEFAKDRNVFINGWMRRQAVRK